MKPIRDIDERRWYDFGHWEGLYVGAVGGFGFGSLIALAVCYWVYAK